jgi:hypothetical protein
MKKQNARKLKGWEGKDRPGKLERRLRSAARRWRAQQARGQVISRAAGFDYTRHHPD